MSARFPIAMTAVLVAGPDACNYSGGYSDTQKFVQSVKQIVRL